VGGAERHVGAEAQLRLGSEDLPRPDDLLVSVGRGDGRKTHVQGYISGKRGMRLRKSPGSDKVGYGLKVPRTPRSRKVAYSGSCLVRE
jgi:hypothetical protein